MSAETRVDRGIFRTAGGWRVYVKHLGRLHARRLANCSLHDARRAREDFAAELRDTIKPTTAPAVRGTFADDAARYLTAVAAMPSIKSRRYDIGLWVAEFGARRRATIATSEVNAVLHRWLTQGYAGATVAHRRTALLHLWTLLDGRGAPNPVRDTIQPPGSEALPRGLPYGMILAILRRMPPSKTRARLAVMAWTGLAHMQVMTMQPHDINWAGRKLYVRRRLKGGAAGFTKPLTAEALAALEDFVHCDAWGRFSPTAALACFRRACGKLALAVGRKNGGIVPYDLRHSYGTAIYKASGDIRATQAAMGHRRIEMTMRYTLGAVDERVNQAVAAFGSTAGLAAPAVPRVTGPVPIKGKRPSSSTR